MSARMSTSVGSRACSGAMKSAVPIRFPFSSCSPFPPAVDRIHRLIQDEAPHRFKYELTAAAVFFAAAVGLLRGRGKGS